MTVLMRDELNDADLAWAAADVAVASVMGDAMRARAAVAAESPFGWQAATSRAEPAPQGAAYFGGRR